ncbi:MAG: bifunctional phosphoribosylaminoimidazolecarboxamide formyltransferase/IMP cyclohydrolase [Dehalococcoidia bacterium]
MRAILSVYNKEGIDDFARGLIGRGFELFSTGGTKKSLEGAGVEVHGISDITGFPEILGGRVKTLHPAVHGGILARRDVSGHMEELAQNGLQTIDLVAVNLYPFRQTIAREGVTLEEALENIDIGGPTMIRAAAKNFPHVLVVVDPADYGTVVEKLGGGGVDEAARKKLAGKAFQHVALYDTVIAQYLRQGESGFPREMTIALEKSSDLRYGENPHQEAAYFREVTGTPVTSAGLAGARQLGGPELSFNNILDLDSAMVVAGDFAEPTVAIIKHTNACGLCSNQDMVEAYRRALAGDPVAAFGGIVALNRTLDMATAREIDKTHYDAIIAPEYDPDALELLQRKSGLRILAHGVTAGTGPGPELADLRRVRGSLLVQSPDHVQDGELSPRTVSRRQPTPEELQDLLFAWRAARHIKSNAIVIAKDRTLLGMGAGQPSRVVSVELALRRAGEGAKGAVLASDAFFPFADGVELAAEGGVGAVIQPGGSVKDGMVIEAADRRGLAMVFTGARHFKH